MIKFNYECNVMKGTHACTKNHGLGMIYDSDRNNTQKKKWGKTDLGWCEVS